MIDGTSAVQLDPSPRPEMGQLMALLGPAVIGFMIPARTMNETVTPPAVPIR